MLEASLGYIARLRLTKPKKEKKEKKNYLGLLGCKSERWVLSSFASLNTNLHLFRRGWKVLSPEWCKEASLLSNPFALPTPPHTVYCWRRDGSFEGDKFSSKNPLEPRITRK
jgi:hypothetical protein